jgi:hypothetical protein
VCEPARGLTGYVWRVRRKRIGRIRLDIWREPARRPMLACRKAPKSHGNFWQFGDRRTLFAAQRSAGSSAEFRSNRIRVKQYSLHTEVAVAVDARRRRRIARHRSPRQPARPPWCNGMIRGGVSCCARRQTIQPRNAPTQTRSALGRRRKSAMPDKRSPSIRTLAGYDIFANSDWASFKSGVSAPSVNQP